MPTRGELPHDPMAIGHGTAETLQRQSLGRARRRTGPARVSGGRGPGAAEHMASLLGSTGGAKAVYWEGSVGQTAGEAASGHGCAGQGSKPEPKRMLAPGAARSRLRRAEILTRGRIVCRGRQDAGRHTGKDRRRVRVPRQGRGMTNSEVRPCRASLRSARVPKTTGGAAGWRGRLRG